MPEEDRSGKPTIAPVAPERLARANGASRRRGLFRRRRRPRRRRIRKLRLLAIAIPLAFLALISTVFGIVLAMGAELPSSYGAIVVYQNPVNSTIVDYNGKKIGTLSNKSQYFVKPSDVPLVMVDAIIAVEDRRFFSEPGVDIRGIARAFLNDIFHRGGTQGASTITEQFAKLVLRANSPAKRTILEKLREAALAFQLSQRWKKSTILTAYLNNVYFGNGATGVEAAARTYFSNDPYSGEYHCGKPSNLCTASLTAADAALLAGLVQSPTYYNPVFYPQAALHRRNVVLDDMYHQGYLTAKDLAFDKSEALPTAQQISSPTAQSTDASAGYFTNWITPQVIARYTASTVYNGGLRIRTTLDIRLQDAAQQAVNAVLPAGQGHPSAALVAIDNHTGEVRAMVGGVNANTQGFNLATQAVRQPGSAWKVFDLAVALEKGVRPSTLIYSGPKTFYGGTVNEFTVHNDEASYAYGKRTLASALWFSDNSVFARLGILIDGTTNIANMAHALGITTPISTNPAMTIGGLATGVTPLDMAHAYSTIANDGRLVTGTWATDDCVSGFSSALYQVRATTCPGPVGVISVENGNGKPLKGGSNIHKYFQTPLSASAAATEKAMLRGVVTVPGATGNAAQIPGVLIEGKTGTTSHYVDAWFVGFTKTMTVAVWVGYLKNRSMKTAYGGKPVYGGTYPAIIFHNYVANALRILAGHAAVKPARSTPTAASGATATTGATSAGAPNGATASSGAGGSQAATGATVAPSAPATGTPSSGQSAPSTPAGPTTPGSVSEGGGSAAPASTQGATGSNG
jgi:penicillin-binding protein 1A